MEKLDGNSLDLINTKIESLKQLFPEVITEGKVDFNKLKLILGGDIETYKEKYEFTWHGKTQALKMAQTQSTGTLRPDKQSSKNWDASENLYIEGDNLEVLKLLQKSYFGKIKVIYIDPPYNTGQDFVYKDDFKDNIKNYKEITEQFNKVNSETSGRFHTDWLNMLYPRLKLARTLLKEDGTIFISIDVNEVHNLRKIADEIFGEANFIEEIIWEKKFSPQNDAKYFSLNHETILCYAKNKEKFMRILLPMTEEQRARYKNPDDDPRGPWQSDNLTVATYNADYDYPITTPSGKMISPTNGRCWSTSKERMQELIKDNRIWFGKDGSNTPRIKRFLSEIQQGRVPISLWYHEEVGHTQSASQELKRLFEDKKYFDFPKPVELIKRCLHISSENDNDIVLDFFSGSGTTAHAVMKLNSEDGKKRKFIMIQLDEPTKETSNAYKAGYKDICEIGKDRINRAGDLIIQETGKKDLDSGYKVFKLDSSNVKPWDPNIENLEEGMLEQLENIKEDRTNEDLLFEILLKLGIPLTTQIEEFYFNGRLIYSIAFGAALICLENEIDLKIVNEMIKLKPEDFDIKVIFKESGFINDTVKTNVIQTLKKNGINDIRAV
ncbi:site-specific DNA-methyltransferase [Cytobacillus sp. S13-E01]|uniref:site-specific DNA-methyltransferase n=1 Tax=Cytobacillus sp. S13-E01 TaxID=3031326 RepID=UPI0023D80DF8|nr:site-specific DNA-methyltransferase [Cytobacillus sp. S13-E01]MDF0728958.1 site-specific DNA-methyltransferase [Cytobacillus sp. S13-E01]